MEESDLDEECGGSKVEEMDNSKQDYGDTTFDEVHT